jgi:hypothetical protein
MLQLVIILKALTEIAGFALLGQGILYLLAGANRDNNVPYRILKTVTLPIFKIARFIAPRFVIDQHVWLLTPLIVIVLWILVTYLKIRLVLGGN